MSHIFLLCIIYLSFISLGLPDSLLGVIWPAMGVDMGQPLAALGLVTVTMTLCSATSSYFAGLITRRLGTGVVVALSCLMTASALLGFSVAPSFGWIIALAVPLGLGAGTVDSCLNHFVAANYSSRHMNWLHGFWGIGATAGPLILGVAMNSDAGWVGGIRTLGFMQLGLAVVLWGTLRLWAREPGQASAAQEAHRNHFKPIHAAALWLAPATFLLYVGAEAGTGLWAASILVGRGHTLAQAGFWVSIYYGAITAGRFGVGWISHLLGNRRVVRLGLALATIGAMCFAVPQLAGAVHVVGLVLMGLGCAPIFPSLMHETARRFPDEVARTVIGRQMTGAYLGGSLVPAGFGVVATWAGLGTIMPVIVLLLIGLAILLHFLDSLT